MVKEDGSYATYRGRKAWISVVLRYGICGRFGWAGLAAEDYVPVGMLE